MLCASRGVGVQFMHGANDGGTSLHGWHCIAVRQLQGDGRPCAVRSACNSSAGATGLKMCVNVGVSCTLCWRAGSGIMG